MNNRYTCLILSLVLSAAAAQAQYYTVSDTLTGLDDHYYCPQWYDECPWYQDSTSAAYRLIGGLSIGNLSRLAILQYPERRMSVKGIAAMVKRIEDYEGLLFYSPHPVKNKEYVYLCTGDSSTLAVRDSARWDTVPPRLWKLPKHQAALTDDFMYCHLFEARFNEPLLVDSAFIMAGSYNSNPRSGFYTYLPTMYLFIEEKIDNICGGMCPGPNAGFLYFHIDSIDYYLQQLGDSSIINTIQDHATITGENRFFGPFFAIVDFYRLDVTSNDEGKGWVTGGGRFPDRSLDTITAYPTSGFCFVQWDDGNTDNPRIIDLTQDTLFTALFDTCPTQHITTPAESSLPFTVQPNPTTGSVTVVTPSDGCYQLTLHNMAGRLLMQTSFTGAVATLDLGHLAAGSYQLSLRSASASGIKVIVKQ